jgi:hypothetical protein
LLLQRCVGGRVQRFEFMHVDDMCVYMYSLVVCTLRMLCMLCMYMRMYVCMHVCMYVYVCIYVRMYLYVCV